MELRTRFAPTPSGYLHIGNAFSFLLTWLIARSRHGKILLRIDDLDETRKRPEYVRDVFESLEWLGLDYDEGPADPSDFEARYSQRHQRDSYQAALGKLKEVGLLFACECTRASLRKTNDGVHPVECRTRGTSLNQVGVAWRVSTGNDPIRWMDDNDVRRSVRLDGAMRDFVVRRKDQIPAYQLASVVDDVRLKVNFVVRGEDLLESTAAQRFIAEHLGDSSFLDASFLHHVLIPDEDGKKLSKSEGATSLRAMRQLDATPARLFQRLAPLLGLDTRVSNATQALAAWNDRPARGTD